MAQKPIAQTASGRVRSIRAMLDHVSTGIWVALIGGAFLAVSNVVGNAMEFRRDREKRREDRTDDRARRREDRDLERERAFRDRRVAAAVDVEEAARTAAYELIECRKKTIEDEDAAGAKAEIARVDEILRLLDPRRHEAQIRILFGDGTVAEATVAMLAGTSRYGGSVRNYWFHRAGLAAPYCDGGTAEEEKALADLALQQARQFCSDDWAEYSRAHTDWIAVVSARLLDSPEAVSMGADAAPAPTATPDPESSGNR